MKIFLRNNGLSIAFLLFFLITICGQVFTGLKQYNSERKEHGVGAVSMARYLGSGHFIEATFENWESEFLQMAMFVAFTTFLYQKGSSESNDPDKKQEVDTEPDPNRKHAPWPVKKGGIILSIYKNSLCFSLFLFFFVSFFLHWYGSMKEYNEHQLLNGKRAETALQYLGNSRLWFESFENWQSEFLSVFAIVLLSVYFRQKGSSQSKPVDAAHSQTGA